MIGTIVHSCASRLNTVSSSETSVTTANKVHPLGFLISDHIFLRNLKIRVLIIKILIIFQFIGNLSLGPEVFKIAKRRMGRGGGGGEGGNFNTLYSNEAEGEMRLRSYIHQTLFDLHIVSY